MDNPIKRKTSLEIDIVKVAAAKEILGTKTVSDTVDAALSDVIKQRQLYGWRSPERSRSK